MSPARRSNRSKVPLVIAAVVVLVALAAVVAIVSSGGDDDDAAAVEAVGRGLDPEAATITIEGEPLPPFQSGADPSTDPAVGQQAPVIEGTNYGGDPVAIDPGDGRAKLVVFLAHWCPHCNAEVPVLLDWHEAGEVPDELDVIGVSTGVTSTRPNFPPDEWLIGKGWTWPVLADQMVVQGDQGFGMAAQAYGLSGYPFFTVIDADGAVRFRGSGELTPDQLAAIASLAVA